MTKTTKVKRVKLTKVEDALLNLATIVGTIPGCDYNALRETLDILGYEKVPPH